MLAVIAPDSIPAAPAVAIGVASIGDRKATQAEGSYILVARLNNKADTRNHVL